MKKNIGTVDRIIRIVLGVGFLVLAFVVSYWFLIPAVLGLGTGISGYCGIYALLKVDTLGECCTPKK